MEIISEENLAQPDNKMVELYKKGTIAICTHSQKDLHWICEWINKEYKNIDIEVLIGDIHNWHTTVYVDKDGKINFDLQEIDLKQYTVDQFIGKDPLNLYESTIKNFSGHEWVKFYEDEQGQPNVQWKEGCHDIGFEAFEGFEQRVEDKYGDEKENLVYRTYMLEADKIRLALKLPPRSIGITMITNFKRLLEEKNSNIKEFLSLLDNEDYYTAKNYMWFIRAMKTSYKDFEYLYSDQSDEDDFYYDLVVLPYLDQNFAIPVPILAQAMKVEEKLIYELLGEGGKSRDEVEFI